MTCAPCSLTSCGSTAAYPTGLAVGIVSARDTGSLGAIAASDLKALGGAIMAAPIPTTPRHASASQRRRLKRCLGERKLMCTGGLTHPVGLNGSHGCSVNAPGPGHKQSDRSHRIFL